MGFVDRNRAVLFLVLSSILWSLGGVFIKLVQWNPIAIAGMRSLISAIFLIVVVRKVKFNRSKDQIICALTYAATVILFVSATKLTTAANAIMLQYTAPIFVAFLSYIVLKEKVEKIDWITIFIVFLGMILFFIGKLETKNFLGNLLSILSGITYALLAIYMRKQKDKSPEESLIIGNLITAVISIPFMLQSMPSKMSWLGLLLLGTIQLGLPYLLYAKAIKHITAIEAVLIPVIEPLLNPLWTFLVLNERPTPWALLGGFVVLSAITFNQVYKLKRRLEVNATM
ncbi:threonine and homoserine efflux system [Caloramator mitchellensis]|uniref:Threonine and homoserine efflux system n=1 Tax=Caloramator mitchellensis TaxID=908809 RepID=A0A0R3JY19_CALMK|nr:DMT family transporter [Caloramator mitchellensis]KRQ85804.1 threonine and homoserine efflux system [Caloramator mitchellensis]